MNFKQMLQEATPVLVIISTIGSCMALGNLSGLIAHSIIGIHIESSVVIGIGIAASSSVPIFAATLKALENFHKKFS